MNTLTHSHLNTPHYKGCNEFFFCAFKSFSVGDFGCKIMLNCWLLKVGRAGVQLKVSSQQCRSRITVRLVRVIWWCTISKPVLSATFQWAVKLKSSFTFNDFAFERKEMLMLTAVKSERTIYPFTTQNKIYSPFNTTFPQRFFISKILLIRASMKNSIQSCKLL